MAGLSIPGNSCCGSTAKPPQSGCAVRLSGQCVYYSGPSIPSLTINTGDLLDVVIQKLSTTTSNLTFNNGLFNNSSTVTFGQPVGQSGNPAKLLYATEIPMNSNRIVFSGVSGIGITIYDNGDFVFDDATSHPVALGEGFTRGVGNKRWGTNTLTTTVGGSQHLLAIGDAALERATTATFCNAIGNNSLSTCLDMFACNAVGGLALSLVAHGSRHNAFGSFALGNIADNLVGNSAFGDSAGVATGQTLTGGSNTFLGQNTSYSSPYNFSHSTALGADAVVGASNAIIIGTSADSVVIGMNIGVPTSKLHVVGVNGYNQLRLATSYTPTSSADANGNTGDVSWDTGFVYIKTGPGAWKRAALTTF